MKRTYVPCISDVVVVTNPIEIRTISNEARFDRDFAGHVPVRNRQRLRKMLGIFSVNGRLFPTMLPRTNSIRAVAQDKLWSRLNAKADEVKHGPAELEPLAELVRGAGSADQLGPWMNVCLHQPRLYARRKSRERSVAVPSREARSSFSGWEERAKVQGIVTWSSSVRLGAAVLQKSGCLRSSKACGRVC